MKIVLSIVSCLLLCLFQGVSAISLAEQFKQVGYSEYCDTIHTAQSYDLLYRHFDELIEFLQAHPVWVKKLYEAKERFIRCKDKNYYATDFFGLYDEFLRPAKDQISFYYSVHFHQFIDRNYPEFHKISPIVDFLNACFEIQKSYYDFFNQAAIELGVEHIFSSPCGHPPILLKVIKYFSSYTAARVHYDGTVFSLFLDSTDYQALLVSAYKNLLTVSDFITPVRKFSREYHQNSIILIPGTLLADFSIYPTPHVVVETGKTRYATIAFAMRPDYYSGKNIFTPLPNFKD